MNCKDCTEYASEFCKDCLEEEMTTTADAGIPKDTRDMGKPKEYRVHDRRYKGKLKMLKKFKQIRK
jgi:hypothetical protein